MVKDDKEKLHVFNSSGLYLATKKIGKSNPKAEQIQTGNEMCMRWNSEVDRALVSGVSETEIQQIKKKYITDRIRESIPQPDNVSKQGHNLLKDPTIDLSAQQWELQPKIQTTEQETPQIPPKPVMSAEAAAYPKLLKIYKELSRQNGLCRISGQSRQVGRKIWRKCTETGKGKCL